MSFKLSYMKFGPVVQEKSFKDISYLELWQPPCSVDWNNFVQVWKKASRGTILLKGSGGNAA